MSHGAYSFTVTRNGGSMTNPRPMAFSLRFPEEVRQKAEAEARKNRRSLNSELGLLIEEGLAWRQKQEQAKA